MKLCAVKYRISCMIVGSTSLRATKSAGATGSGSAVTGPPAASAAAFLLPFMNSWRGGDPMNPQAIVLAPTRELAVQIEDTFKALAKGARDKGARIVRFCPVTGVRRDKSEWIVSTPQGDIAETNAVKAVFGDQAVRSLAERASNAAKDIAGLVTAVNDATPKVPSAWLPISSSAISVPQ